ncbi:unnamed protein product [Notodromas monacha]|uniref:CAAX prenyl protease 2 n=1 Tax=Notodromas monacha TaxID=399045 RepID=A0A7R9G9A2_9CRUS|nr:unnamed protein product [Notodromas monacha]CAG0912967.1 unnamed protein product [Notodromas monacha]
MNLLICRRIVARIRSCVGLSSTFIRNAVPSGSYRRCQTLSSSPYYSRTDLKGAVLGMIEKDVKSKDWRLFVSTLSGDQLLIVLETLDEFGAELSGKTLVTVLTYLAKCSASSGDLRTIQECRRLLFILCGPASVPSVLNFQQYDAEFLWFVEKDFSSSVDILTKLYCRYPNEKRKISSMAAHFMWDAVTIPVEEKLVRLKNLVDNVRIFFKGCYNIPALNLWRPCFLSSNFSLRRMAEVIIEENPRCIEILPGKVVNLVKDAVDRDDVDFYHRMIELVLKYPNLHDYLAPLLNGLLVHHCVRGDVRNVEEVVNSILTFGIRISPESLPLFLNFLCSHRRNRRDDPRTVKRRFASVCVSCIVSCIYTYTFSDADSFEEFKDLTGLRTDHLMSASFLPVLLTSLLFLGPLVVLWQEQMIKKLCDLSYWRGSIFDIFWLRNYVVAPFSEELVYRSCLIAMLSKSTRCLRLVMVSPLFFGVAHVHHVIDSVGKGIPVKTALLMAVFQFGYTTLFGAYSSFLLMRTGHFVSPLIAHAFCNAMGFPDFTAIWYSDGIEGRIRRMALFGGFLAWLALLYPLTDPRLYGGSVHWTQC